VISVPGRGSFLPSSRLRTPTRPTATSSAPLATSAGYHVILVDSAYHTPTEEEARSLVEERFASGANGWVDFVLRTADVNVDRRYGAWDPTTGSVNPPEGAQEPSGGALNSAL
jgi:hypothetical protein